MANQKMTYQDAYDQLSTLIYEIENEEVPLDELPAKIRLATELITFCQERLRSVETEYQDIIERIPRR
ncbi:exodeoxyribonuclease VII small subunit [Spirosoma sp. KUDC1026]|uniref:exodeoxyribonuclease VII small subunit n=1 Tax=Spirosoma sp. KUDC1026 TaxID=2745947 RepID=UPI001E2DDA21|nr:exodeoxyribonuclease VII small subunit [Spirosoma sp. KUDC1026]